MSLGVSSNSPISEPDPDDFDMQGLGSFVAYLKHKSRSEKFTPIDERKKKPVSIEFVGPTLIANGIVGGMGVFEQVNFGKHATEEQLEHYDKLYAADPRKANTYMLFICGALPKWQKGVEELEELIDLFQKYNDAALEIGEAGHQDLLDLATMVMSGEGVEGKERGRRERDEFGRFVTALKALWTFVEDRFKDELDEDFEVPEGTDLVDLVGQLDSDAASEAKHYVADRILRFITLNARAVDTIAHIREEYLDLVASDRKAISYEDDFDMPPLPKPDEDGHYWPDDFDLEDYLA